MDVDTRKMARNMVFSVIPLLIMQIPSLFHFSTSSRNFTLMISLIIAVSFLISYFIYQVSPPTSSLILLLMFFSAKSPYHFFLRQNAQIFKPQIEKTRLEYIKHDDLILRIFQRVEKQTLQKILAEDGTPNVTAISG